MKRRLNDRRLSEGRLIARKLNDERLSVWKTEAVAQRCSVKKVFLEISQNS